MTARTSSAPRGKRLGIATAGLLGLLLPAALGAGGSAQASYPGTNGKIICSGALATEIADPVPAGQSRLELFSVNPDGTGTTRLMTNTNSDFSPRYSADGTKVAFVRDNQIWTMNADGTNIVGPLTSIGTSTFVGDWSPDGTKIVYQTNPGNPSNFEVFVMNADGSNQTNLTNNTTAGASSDSQPAWSPDGTKIAFQSNRAGNPNIHVMNADGSNVVNLTGDSPAEESAPRWSPDGTKIAFHSDRAVFPRPGVARNLEIYRMNADGSDVTRLTFNDYDQDVENPTSTSNLTGFDLFPAWSPDGTRIVFHSGRAEEHRSTGAPGIVGQWDVYHLDAVTGEGTGQTGTVRVTNRAGNDERCDWQPIPRQTLTVAVAGDGSGTVVSAPAGIDCGADCTEAFAKDTEVTLAASPASGSTFAGFSGGGCSGTSATCTVTMSEARTVTATFTKTPPAVEDKPPATVPPVVTVTPPTYTIPRRAARLSARVTPRRDRRRPFRFRVTGRLTRPAGVSAADGCQGRVTVRFKSGRKTISSRRVKLNRSCRFSSRVTFKKRRWGRRSVLRVQVKFEGNKFLLPKSAKLIRARVR